MVAMTSQAPVDLHTHLLPALDDGSQSIEETVEMLRLAYLDGTRTMVATPHMFSPAYPNFEPRLVEEVFDRTLGELANFGCRPEYSFLSQIELRLGAENYVTPEFLQALAKRKVLGLNHGRYLLVEFSPQLSWDMVQAACDRIFEAGYVPVLAHVERYPRWAAREERIRSLIERGCRIQINGESFLDRRSAVGRISYALLKKALVHVVASDNHGTCQGSLPLSSVWHLIAAASSPQVPEALMARNPTTILHPRQRARCPADEAPRATARSELA